MEWRTRQAALRAVAKLTWGGTSMALACSGATTSTPRDGAGGALAAAAQPSADEGGAAPEMRPTVPASGGTGMAGTGERAAAGCASSPNCDGTDVGPMGGAGGQSEDSAGGSGGATAIECTATIDFDPDHVVRVTIPDEELACCAAEVLERMGAAEAKTDPSVINCCTAIVLASNSSSPHYGSAVRTYCCSGGLVAEPKALYELPYCTPWGPPVPPPMLGAVA